MQDVNYALKVFLIALRVDKRHLFNCVYFVLSFVGIFKHTVFSFLLLEIIIKIPLLTNVVQTIVHNRYQLIYTAMLLFVTLYIYSFIAFTVFRETYINADDNPDDNPD